MEIRDIQLALANVELGQFFDYGFTIVVETSWSSFLIPSGYLHYCFNSCTGMMVSILIVLLVSTAYL